MFQSNLLCNEYWVSIPEVKATETSSWLLFYLVPRFGIYGDLRLHPLYASQLCFEL